MDDTPCIVEVLSLIRKLYSLPACGSGGYLCHVVLCDGNLATYFIEDSLKDCDNDNYCSQYNISLEVRNLSRDILEKMRIMTMTQRRKIYNSKYT